jgi:hypothetical protein
MAYTYTNSKGKTYHLHQRDARGNTGTKLYFFAGEEKEGTVDELPSGYEVSETSRGLPVLKKTGGSTSNAGNSGSRSRKK